MTAILETMAADHRRCDDLFVAMEEAVSHTDWERADQLMNLFIEAMESHFAVEEEDLFDALEGASRQAAGPIRVMLMEHDQMRHLIKQLRSAMESHSKGPLLGITDTLLITMQQHNMKEENVLYPMADREVPEIAGTIVDRIKVETE